MNTNIIKLVAALAWGGVAVSSAAPANALAATANTGPYASCSNTHEAYARAACGYQFNYRQYIKVYSLGGACSSGACSSTTMVTYVESAYGTGRKTTTPVLLGCDQVYNIYGLGTCAC
jgi:hypothetical protein